MIVGVPAEIKTYEYRVGLLPVGAAILVEAGHRVLFQRGAGVIYVGGSGKITERVSMAGNFFDGTDAELLSGSVHFDAKISAAPTMYGLTVEQAGAYNDVNGDSFLSGPGVPGAVWVFCGARPFDPQWVVGRGFSLRPASPRRR